MDLTILTCNHNTNDLIINLVESIRSTCSDSYKILVMNTGSESTPYKEMAYGASYCDQWNTSHGDAVNYGMEMVDTKYMLLVDSDVLFLKDIKHPFEKFKESGLTLMGEVVGDRGGKSIYDRVNPWFCFMNLDDLKSNNIKFYDHHRTKVLKSEKIYDIGCSMFEDVVGKGLWVGDAKMENKYFKHYEGMSWRVQKYNPDNGDTDIDVGGTHDNVQLYKLGLQVRERYIKDIANL